MTTAKYRPPTRAASLDHALARLGASTRFDAAVADLIRDLSGWRSDPPGTELVQGGDGELRLITQGWAARVRWLDASRRQIFNFMFVGDLVGVAPLQSVTTVALTAIQTVDAAPLLLAARDGAADGALDKVVHSARVTEAELVLSQVVRLGHYDAYERLADLILELYRRADMAGLVTDGRTPFPLTQEMLADATGLSIVHVNRVLQRLRAEHLVEVRQGQLIVLNQDGLAKVADQRDAALG